MKAQDFDTILEKNLKNPYKKIDISNQIMNRINLYKSKQKKSIKILHQIIFLITSVFILISILLLEILFKQYNPVILYHYIPVLIVKISTQIIFSLFFVIEFTLGFYYFYIIGSKKKGKLIYLLKI